MGESLELLRGFMESPNLTILLCPSDPQISATWPSGPDFSHLALSYPHWPGVVVKPTRKSELQSGMSYLFLPRPELNCEFMARRSGEEAAAVLQEELLDNSAR